ncbi:MAG: cytochrome c oxidase subunit II [Verrucomicrobia bacterium]|nr:cytochrome c oxidase subunit II [Verrucomicrobiota bacterium]
MRALIPRCRLLRERSVGKSCRTSIVLNHLYTRYSLATRGSGRGWLLVGFTVATFVGFLSWAPVARAQDSTIRAVQNIFDPLSAPAETLYSVSLLVMAVCAAIFLIVGGLLTYAIIRYRRRGPEDDQEEPPQVYGSAAIELAWTVPPILIVVMLVLVTARTIGEIQHHQMPAAAEEIRVIGHRFWWEVRYPKHDVVTANEIHVSLSDRKNRVPTEMILESADVIHGFWVPQLNGKTMLVPNYRNTMWIEPYATGVYLGNCTVLCGQQHANMLIRVVVDKPDVYQKWLESQKQTPVSDSQTEEGQKQFVASSCGTCHTIDGLQGANGVFAPNLTHFASRATLGSGVAPNDEQNLRSWLKDPQVLKAGCLMPNMQLTDNQVDAILAYLRSLK